MFLRRTNIWRIERIVLLKFVLVALLGLSVAAQEKGTAMSHESQQFLVELLGTRDGWPENMTADERRVMGEHFAYLKGLTRRGSVLVAGPVDGRYGLIVLEAGSEEEARRIMENEPSVAQGVHTYRMYPMTASLMASKMPRFRYVEGPTDKALIKTVSVSASLADVWRSWTTTEGVESFIAPKANVELRVGGPYEWYFAVESPPGEQGSEDCRVLSYIPMRMLSFEWNAPPSFGELRHIKTYVVLEFDESQPGTVEVTLTHRGWGDSEEWQKVYDYFDSAWGYVMGQLKSYFEK